MSFLCRPATATAITAPAKTRPVSQAATAAAVSHLYAQACALSVPAVPQSPALNAAGSSRAC